MKTIDIQKLRIDKGPARTKHRRALRELFIQKLNIDESEGEFDALVEVYFKRAKAVGDQAREERRLQHRHLNEQKARQHLPEDDRELNV